MIYMDIKKGESRSIKEGGDMFVLALEIIHQCNLNCNYCYLGKKKNKRMSTETIDNAIAMGIKEAKKQNDKNLDIYFIGGEPLLCFEEISIIVKKVISKCKINGIIPTFSTTTNGTLLSQDIVDFFVKYNFDWKISIDGNEVVHDLNRKNYLGNGSYRKIRENLRFKEDFEKRTDKYVHAAQVISTNNVEYFLDSFQHLKELGFKYIETDINKYEKWNEQKKSKLKDEIIRSVEFYHAATSSGDIFYWHLYEQMIKEYFSNINFYDCKAAAHSLFVTVDGVLYSCCECLGMEVGRIEEKKLDVSKIRKVLGIHETKNQKCLKCEYIRKCKARGCIVDNWSINKNVFEPIDISCFMTKIFFEIINNEFTNQEKEIFIHKYGGIKNG